MPAVYDILGLIIGLISLLAFAKHAKRLIVSRLPPGRLRAMEGTIMEMRTVIDRLEQGSRAVGTTLEVWTKHREILDGFAQPLNDLWLAVKRWERRGLARFSQVHGGIEFARLYRDLKRKVDACYRDLMQHLDRQSHSLQSQTSPITAAIPLQVIGTFSDSIPTDDDVRVMEFALEVLTQRHSERRGGSEQAGIRSAPGAYAEEASHVGGTRPPDSASMASGPTPEPQQSPSGPARPSGESDKIDVPEGLSTPSGGDEQTSNRLRSQKPRRRRRSPFRNAEQMKAASQILRRIGVRGSLPRVDTSSDKEI